MVEASVLHGQLPNHARNEAEAPERAEAAGAARTLPHPDVFAESLRLALAQERETVRKTYLEVAELRHRLATAEARHTKLKVSLTYKLGEAIVSTRTLKGALTLVPRLHATYRASVRAKARSVRPEPAPPVPIARRAAALQQALSLVQSRGHGPAAQWVRSNVRDVRDRAHVIAELGFSALPADPATASDLALESERLVPGFVRVKALRLSIAAVRAAAPA